MNTDETTKGTAPGTMIMCNCKHPGKDDGEETCFIHHDCRDGGCTHAEVSE